MKVGLRKLYFSNRSFFPLYLGLQVSSLIGSLVVFSKYGYACFVWVSAFWFFLSLFVWLSLAISESCSGKHSSTIELSYLTGFSIFVFSEIWFFCALFGGVKDGTALFSSIKMSVEWPPMGVVSINPTGVACFNTIVLILSGMVLVWGYYLQLNKDDITYQLFISVILGFVFLCGQVVEYVNCAFSLGDGFFGSCFYISTGFHTIHVIFGVIALCVNTYLSYTSMFILGRQLSLKFGILYWHFVDLVWLVLYCVVYTWPR